MYITLNNLNLYYEKYGTGQKEVLILPGWGNTRETFRYMISELENDFTIYILDYPGLGLSPVPDKALTLYDYTELIIAFMKKFNINKPIVIAHSFGGRITAILSGYYKIKLDRLILIDVAGLKPRKKLKIRLKQYLYKMLKKLTYLLPKLKQETARQKLLKYFASSDYNSLPPGMHQTFKNIIKEDLSKYYKQIPNETILLWGSLDQDTPLYQAKKLNKLIKNSALIVLKNATHFSYLNYPKLTNSIIKSFLK